MSSKDTISGAFTSTPLSRDSGMGMRVVEPALGGRGIHKHQPKVPVLVRERRNGGERRQREQRYPALDAQHPKDRRSNMEETGTLIDLEA